MSAARSHQQKRVQAEENDCSRTNETIRCARSIVDLHPPVCGENSNGEDHYVVVTSANLRLEKLPSQR
eukprot:1210006-Amphidinium_carterae.1